MCCLCIFVFRRETGTPRYIPATCCFRETDKRRDERAREETKQAGGTESRKELTVPLRRRAPRVNHKTPKSTKSEIATKKRERCGGDWRQRKPGQKDEEEEEEGEGEGEAEWSMENVLKVWYYPSIHLPFHTSTHPSICCSEPDTYIIHHQWGYETTSLCTPKYWFEFTALSMERSRIESYYNTNPGKWQSDWIKGAVCRIVWHIAERTWQMGNTITLCISPWQLELCLDYRDRAFISTK